MLLGDPMSRLVSMLVIFAVALSAGLFVHASVSAQEPSVLLQPNPQDGVSCEAVLEDLHASAEVGMGSEMGPLTKVIQVFGIAPGMELVPVGVMLNFEDSSTWYGKQQPFSSTVPLKWGIGGFRSELDGSTKLTGLIVPIGGTIANFEMVEGKMTPLKTPWEGALETGALVIKPVDITNPKEWVYVYSSYTPENWNCEQGSVFP